MSIVIALIGILVAVIALFSIVTNHINYKLNKLENRLDSIDNDIKYNQYLLNDKDTDNTDKDIKVVIYGNGRKVYEYKE